MPLALFGGKRRRPAEEAAPQPASVAEPAAAPALAAGAEPAADFAALGLSKWLRASLSHMGLTRPTPIQCACLPPILAGRDAIGCAETGSGKTAAFALPILERLGQDPWGIAALVLTPSRELAFQISEQFTAFGAPLRLRVVTVTGGVDQVLQGGAVAALPHVLVATPGRLAHMLTSGPAPPDLSRLAFLVLDEVDRLADESFAPDLSVILARAAAAYPACQTLLFSATLGANVPRIAGLRISPLAFRFDSSSGGGGGGGSARAMLLPATLRQEYLFIPAAVKNAYLIHLLLRLGPVDLQLAAAGGGASGSAAGGGSGRAPHRPAALKTVTGREAASGGSSSKPGKGAAASASASASASAMDREHEEDLVRARSIIIFVSTCAAAACVTELCKELSIPCTALHSVMPQSARLGSLAKFRGEMVRVLVATDVASRGLDLPSVDLVVNYDVPRKAEDYVHRVGRTARAGRGGRAVTLVTQYEMELIVALEAGALGGARLPAIPDFLVVEKEVLARLGKVAAALEVAKSRLVEIGFAEALDTAQSRKGEASDARKASAAAAGAAGGGQ